MSLDARRQVLFRNRSLLFSAIYYRPAGVNGYTL